MTDDALADAGQLRGRIHRLYVRPDGRVSSAAVHPRAFALERSDRQARIDVSAASAEFVTVSLRTADESAREFRLVFEPELLIPGRVVVHGVTTANHRRSLAAALVVTSCDEPADSTGA